MFDKEAVQSELDLQVQVTKEFGTVAPNLVANASEKLGNVSEYETIALIKADAEKTLAQTSDETERTKLVQIIQQADEYLTANKTAYETWKEGGIGRALLQSGVGGLMTGNANGALAGGSISLAAPYLNEAEEKLGSTGTLINALGGAVIGYAVGGNAGSAAVGANVDWYNRQLHPSEYKLAEQYADIVASRLKISREEALGRIIRHMQRTVDYATAKADNFRTDDAIISILGANNLPKQDQHYTNPNYNKQYIQNYVRDFNLANQYNYFGKTPTQSRDYKVGVVTDFGKAALNSGIGIFESAANLATGEIDPNSWAYVHMGRLSYTHPEYGNALENTMTLGVAAVTAGRAGTQVRARNTQQTKLVGELTANGIKFNPNNVVTITKTTDGKIVWLETGNTRAGLNHIIERHGQEFLKKGISESEIPNYLMTAVKNGQIVGMQRTRPIYEFTYNGTKHRVAIDIGNNGFIVGANPKGVVK